MEASYLNSYESNQKCPNCLETYPKVNDFHDQEILPILSPISFASFQFCKVFFHLPPCLIHLYISLLEYNNVHQIKCSLLDFNNNLNKKIFQLQVLCQWNMHYSGQQLHGKMLDIINY